MIAATSRAAMPSARWKSVSRITAPAIAVKANAARSVSTCWNAPSTLSERRSASGQHPGRGEVDDDADQRDDEQRSALDVGRVDQAADALVDDEQRRDQQRRPVELRREDLRR